MIFEAVSSPESLVFNGKPEHIVNPWVITVDTDSESITVRKRNWHLIGKDEETLSFRFIRKITIDQHLIGADIHIKIMGGTISALCLNKSDAKKIKQILMDYNLTKKGKGIIFS